MSLNSIINNMSNLFDRATTKEFDILISSVLGLIKEDKLFEAKTMFNKDIFPKFRELVWEKTNPLNHFVFFFCELDEFLNNEGAKILGVSGEEKILDLYENEYKEEFFKLASGQD